MLEMVMSFYGATRAVQQAQEPTSSPTLKNQIQSGTLRYDYNARLAAFTGPFDYMELQCDRQSIIYSIHGKDLSLDGIWFALPLSLIKPIYQTFIFPAEVIVDPLQMEIDDELIMFLYHILHLYEKGKLIAAESNDGSLMRITSIG